MGALPWLGGQGGAGHSGRPPLCYPCTEDATPHRGPAHCHWVSGLFSLRLEGQAVTPAHPSVVSCRVSGEGQPGVKWVSGCSLQVVLVRAQPGEKTPGHWGASRGQRPGEPGMGARTLNLRSWCLPSPGWSTALQITHLTSSRSPRLCQPGLGRSVMLTSPQWLQRAFHGP